MPVSNRLPVLLATAIKMVEDAILKTYGKRPDFMRTLAMGCTLFKKSLEQKGKD